MASALKARLSEEMKSAMKNRETQKLTFVRNLHAAIRKKEIDERIDLDDGAVMKIVRSALKQRKESLDQFEKGGREDLATNERAEISFLQSYLPEQMSEDELKKKVELAITETQAKSPKDMGLVMKSLLPMVEGKADTKLLSQLVKDRLASLSG